MCEATRNIFGSKLYVMGKSHNLSAFQFQSQCQWWIFFAQNLRKVDFFNSVFEFQLKPKKFRTTRSQRKMGSIFFQRLEDSNLGWLDGERDCYLCAMPSPAVEWTCIDMLKKISEGACVCRSSLQELSSRKTEISSRKTEIGSRKTEPKTIFRSFSLPQKISFRLKFRWNFFLLEIFRNLLLTFCFSFNTLSLSLSHALSQASCFAQSFSYTQSSTLYF